MGSPILVTGKVSGAIGNVPGPPGGSRGSTKWGHRPQRAAWAKCGKGPAPRWAGAPPHPRVSNPRRRGRPKGGAPAQQGLVLLPLQPMGTSGIGGPTRWSRYNTGDPETFPMAETGLPIYKSLPPDHSGTPRDVRDLIRDFEQHSVCCILIFIQP